MIARLLISPDITKIKKAIGETLSLHFEGVKLNHPDVLHFRVGEKLGISEARKIKSHFALKPFSAKGRVLVIEDAGSLTIEAQNALLKTLEEPPKEAILILGVASDTYLLPTILSRCQIIRLDATDPTGITNNTYESYVKDVEKMLDSTAEERFAYVEKLKDKESFLHNLTQVFREMLYAPGPRLAKLEVNNFLKELLQAEEWAKQNVNIRAILEYLMLVMPRDI